ncbi:MULTISPECIES: ABC transporter permease subunit [unclassified Streptomyces]|uniref:ABC transporter permease subunit n=1 Tax=unclassified Streptomyces TaxID=2593676 RepID=UPI0022B64B66|nr:MULTISPECIES: ABC transporter permease subunit [unclassified Streptomyces]MCZ7416480.1 ABC transporter permease subunit [Streptomyces sp. WMMC897]MCZ7433709.1 ABC transporter permease subunit [Streptomyces sp. WMMC1477]
MAHTTRVLRSEWTKAITVRATMWTLGIAFLVTVAIGVLISLVINSSFEDLPERDRLTFDPVLTSFAGMSLGQLAMIAFGILLVSNEYSTGMIRASLAAVPQRGTFMTAKLVVGTGLVLVVGMITSFVSFFLGQAMLGDLSVSLGDENVLRAVIGGGLYMTLIALFAMGVTWILRSALLAFSILVPLFFLVTPILANIEATRDVGYWFPDQAGGWIMSVVDTGDRPYGPWGGLLIMVGWTAVALVAGYLTLRKRDA